MDELGRVTSQAARRIVLERFGRSGGWWACAGAGAGLIGVAACKTFGLTWLLQPEQVAGVIERPWIWGAWMLAAGVIGAAAGGVVAIVRRPSALEAARRVDHALNLRDRLSIGVELRSGARGAAPHPAGDPFIEVVVEDASAAASQASVPRAIHPRLGTSWMWAAIMLVIGAAAGVWSPMWTSAARSAEAERHQQRVEREVAAADIQRVISDVRRAAPKPATSEQEAEAVHREALQAIEQIERELRGERGSGEQARQQAAAALKNAAAEIDQHAQRHAQEAEAVRDALNQAARRAKGLAAAPDRAVKNLSTPGERLAKALQSSDFAEAKRAAGELLNSPNTPENRVQDAEALERLARDLEEIETRREQREQREARAAALDVGEQATSARAESGEVRGRDQVAPQDQHRAAERDSNAEKASSKKNAAGTEERPLDTQQREPPTPTSPTSDAAPDSDEPSPQEPSNAPSRFAERLRDAAEQLRNQAPLSAKEPRSGSSQPNNEDQQSEVGQPKRTFEEPSATSAEQSESNKKGEQSQTRDGNKEPRSGVTRPTEPPASEKNGVAGAADTRRDARDPLTPATKAADSQSGGSPREQESENQQEVSEQQVNEQQARQRRSPQAGSDEAPNEIPDPGQQGVQRLAEELDRLARAPREVASQRERAENLRRQAQELIDRSTPEQRERLRQWQEALARRGEKSRDDTASDPGASASSPQTSGEPQALDRVAGSPGQLPSTSVSQTQSASAGHPRDAQASDSGEAASHASATDRTPIAARTAAVDARSKTPPEGSSDAPVSVIAEWFGDGAHTAASSQRVTEALGRATKSAERAIEDRAVPRRFNSAVERYFQRLPKALVPVEGSGSSNSPAAPAKDAP